ncbi:MAG: M20 family metallopeptidase [Deferrisomatales bacterium]
MKAALRPERLRELFFDLVGIYSPSGKEEGVLAHLEDFLAAQGCPYTVQPVDENRYNLVLGRPDAELLFVGHVDTVHAWDLEDLGPRETGEGWVRGLGAADMKGGCAALVEAFLVLREAGRAGPFGLALVVGEEEEGDGAQALLREARPRRALVGEPTNLRLCTGHFGYLEVALSATGRRVHASVPELGENAAEAVLSVLHALSQDPAFRGVGPVASIRHLETSNPGFAVPARAAAWVDVHVPPSQAMDPVKAAVRRLVRAHGRGRVTVEFPVAQAGFQMDEEDPLVRAYRLLRSDAPELFRSHSDANTFHAAGVPTAVLGPGSLEWAHTEGEQVRFAEVLEAAELYVALAGAYAGG